MADDRRQDLRPYGWGAILSLAAVVYLTLLPFEFRDIPLAEAWRQYLAMQAPPVSSGMRQQWMANVLMFMPLGFFWTAWLTLNVRSLATRVFVALLVSLFCLFVTLAVEFGQVWLPYRNPSPHDISANFVGGVVGAGIGLIWGSRIKRWVAIFRSGDWRLDGHQVLTLYVVAYVLMSLAPFDFLLSVSEVQGRLASDQWSWWMRPDQCDETLIRCAALDVARFLLAVPLGWWLVRSLAGRSKGLVLVAAFGVGLAIEIAQFFVVTGRADGYSGLLRAAGVGTGVLSAPVLAGFDVRRWKAGWGRPAVLLLVLPYASFVAVVVFSNSGFHWDPSLAWTQFQSLRFLPFHNHYFVPETVALRSLLLNLMLYAPVGVLLWLWSDGGRQTPSGSGHGLVFVVGALFALTIEAAKLFASGLRPDPTGVWIGGAAAWATFVVLSWLEAMAWDRARPMASFFSAPGQSRDARPVEGGAVGTLQPAHIDRQRFYLASAAGLILVAVALFVAVRHPIAPGVAVAAVAVYGALILRWPRLWLVLVPATLPVLDLTPWTGRLYFDEWDLLVLTTLAALLLRWGLGWTVAPRVASVKLGRAGRLWFFAFLVSYVAAIVIALWPPAWPDTLTWTSLHNPYNALRLAKGVLWALLLWPFFFRVVSDRDTALHLFSLGMVLGLTAAVISVLWERALFPGLFDFAQHYRVVGLFSAAHTGGAFLEGYLVTAAPFLAMALIWRPRLLSGPVALLLFVLAAYAVAVTYARAGYGGLLVVVAAILVAALLRFGGARRSRVFGVVALLVATSGGLAVLNHVQQETFMADRVDADRIDSDWQTRTAHWRASLEPLLSDPRATWFGLGIGRFPELNFWESVARGRPAPAMHHLVARDGETILALLPGGAHYVWQAVAVDPETEYRAQVMAQASQGSGRLVIGLCEKWILYSRRCVMQTLTFDDWRVPSLAEVTLTSRGPLVGHWFAQRPTKFVIFNPGRDQAIEVAEVRLLDPAGNELLANGDFQRGMDRWFFTSDDHLAWNIKNLWFKVTFEQGLVGLAIWSLLIMAALWGAFRWTRVGGDRGWFGAVLLAALLGFLAVGMFDSLFNSARLATLFYLLVLLALARESAPRPGEAA